MGRMLRLLTAGESHGKGLAAVLEGLPADVPITADAIAHELARRRQGYGRGGRQKIEADSFESLAGVRHGRTLGSPVAVTIANVEFEQKYRTLMSAEGEVDPAARLTRPRPGHADLVGAQKYGFDDVRNVLERASARETAARVAAGVFCKAFLGGLGIEVLSHVVRIGKVRAPARIPTPADRPAVDRSPVRCADDDASARDGRRDRPGPESEGHPRRRVRGPRVRTAAGDRLLRAVGPEVRRAPGRGADVDPVGQRGRGG